MPCAVVANVVIIFSLASKSHGMSLDLLLILLFQNYLLSPGTRRRLGKLSLQ